MRARFAVLITAVALTVVAVWLVFRIDPSAAPTNGETTRIRGPVGESMRESSSPDAGPDPSPLTTLSDEGLFDHPDCHFTAGKGPASGAGLFIVPGENESRFLVRNQEGALFGDDLPFVPRVYAVGKRDDGVLAVLGDMQLHDRDSQEPRLHGHARVYFNGQIIYENEELWGYGIAADGSSFFAIEPLAGETSRLVLRNLDAGEEHHFDLGRQMTYFDNHGRPYGWYYTSSMSEVILAPPQQLNGTPRGIYWFYANDGNGPRVIRIRSADVPLRSDDAVLGVDPRQVRDEPILRGGVLSAHDDRVHFESSEMAYHMVDHSREGRESFGVRKSAYRGYGEDGGPQRSDVWTWERPGSYPHGLVVSANGAWVALQDRYRDWALDADTGELVFAFPTTEDLSPSAPSDRVLRSSYLTEAYRTAALERLASVLRPEATAGDLGGRGGGLQLDGDLLMIRRHFGQGSRTRYFHDVFNLTAARVDAPPLFRIPVNRDCRSAALAGWRTVLSP